MIYTAEHIARITGGKFHGGNPRAAAEHLLTDSRKLLFPESSVFFALDGPRRRGSQFIEDLYQRGVRLFVVPHLPEGDFPEAGFVVASDPLAALQALAAHHRKQFHYPVIGITGSNGKTIVKEWLNQLLQRRYDIVRSPKSYNSQSGVPLSVWQMEDHHQLGIFEAGISRTGEMEKLQRVLQPDIGVFTNIGEAHSEGFLHPAQKIREKLQLFSQSQVLVYCSDYAELQENIVSLRQKLGPSGPGGQGLELFAWSAVSEARVQLLNIFREGAFSSISVRHNERNFTFTIPFTDEASVENAMTCCSVLLYLGIPETDIISGMAALAPVAMRLELKPAINQCTLINDSYSADVSSLRIALDFLQQQSAQQSRTVILSDILESGRQERKLYQEVADQLAKHQVKRLIGIGEKISRQRPVFEAQPDLASRFFPNVEAFLAESGQMSFGHEAILLKGARVFEFERIDALLQQKLHQTVMEIDLGAVAHNLKQYQAKLQPATRIMAMVKAFAYGSGGYQVARTLQFHRVDYLGVAYADEAVELRKAGIHLPVMVMNTDPSTFASLLQYDLEPVLYSLDQAAVFSSFLEKEGINLFPVHIELETGMQRLGFSEDQLPGLEKIVSAGRFKIQSIFSHLAASEDAVHDRFTRRQGELFERMSRRIQEKLPYRVWRHIANSSGMSRHPDLQFDMVRLGIGLYGIAPAGESMNLREVSTLRSVIAQVKELPAGETVGYGRFGVTERPTRIATVAIGYADGYPRLLSGGRGKMWVNGQLAPVIGRVCMDMTMIDITGIPDVKEGDSVLVFGGPLPVTDVAEWAETIPYEILTGISQRVKRIYFEE